MGVIGYVAWRALVIPGDDYYWVRGKSPGKGHRGRADPAEVATAPRWRADHHHTRLDMRYRPQAAGGTHDLITTHRAVGRRQVLVLERLGCDGTHDGVVGGVQQR